MTSERATEANRTRNGQKAAARAPQETRHQDSRKDQPAQPAGDAGDEQIMTNDQEYLCQMALVLRLRGLTYRQIADHFNKNERTVRRWAKKAREKGLLRVHKLKPWEELSSALTMFDEFRSDLIDLKERARESGDGILLARCLRELTMMEERRLKILDRANLFDGYSPQQRNPFGDDGYLESLTPENRTSADDFD